MYCSTGQMIRSYIIKMLEEADGSLVDFNSSTIFSPQMTERRPTWWS
jgi:hypothetical protein